MTDTATPETGPVDAPASIESVAAEIRSRMGDNAPDASEDVDQELVEEAEGSGEAAEAEPEAEEATETDEVEAETPEEGNPDEQLVTVKVDGEERQVPLSEALAGYSRLEDYKAKTAAVAEERRQVEALKSNVEAQTKAEYANQLEEATNLFAQFDPVLAEAQRINWDALKQSDPAAFVAAQDAVNERLTAIQQMKQHVEKIRGETQQHQQAELQRERAERFDRAADEIVKLRPELADEAKFQAFAGETVEFLERDGFTREEIVDALDHRVLRLADDARQWRAHVAAQKSLPERKVVPKSAVKPLTSDGSGSSQPRSRFPANAPRDKQLSWAVSQILKKE